MRLCDGDDETPVDFTSCATLSLTETARVLGIHRSTAWELYRRGEFPLPILKVGRRLLVAKIHLERFLREGGSPGWSSVP